MRERRNVKIRGLVQGVYFRETVRRIALGHAVDGFVRNVDYDLVEIDVEGEAAVVEAFVDEVLANPPVRARVVDVQTTVLAPEGAEGFRVASSVRAG
ncbi:MAG TPA: acylphosphatase [Candidatus Acidoferrales bacterium]|nr:acylphosphatase [Candidatus Acidoferrales bacterium]